MNITIDDDMDLALIADSGQLFRVGVFDDGTYRFIFRDDILYIRQVDDKTYDISCDKEKWNKVWYPYFDLDRNYSELRRQYFGRHELVDASMECGKGIRVLRQDPWEMLVTFIISQRKSIPAITTSVTKICEKFGKKVKTEREELYIFPDAPKLSRATDDELRSCSLGYRAPYVADAARWVDSGMLDLDELDELDDETLFEALKQVRGVGDKVANCVCLFAYARLGRVPVDVWISRAIEDCGGVSPFELFGDDAGIIQQYVFYFERVIKQK